MNNAMKYSQSQTVVTQCNANSRDGEQYKRICINCCIFCPDSGSVRTGQMNGIV